QTESFPGERGGGGQADRRAVLRRCLLKVARLLEPAREVVAVDRVVRTRRDGLAERCGRPLRVAGILEGQTESVEEVRVFRADEKRAPEGGGGARVVRRELRDAEIPQVVGVRRLQPNGLRVGRERRLRVAGRQ